MTAAQKEASPFELIDDRIRKAAANGASGKKKA